MLKDLSLVKKYSLLCSLLLSNEPVGLEQSNLLSGCTPRSVAQDRER